MKKRMGVWWEKIRAEPWVALLISLLTVLSLIFLTVVICGDPDWIYPRLGVKETAIGKKYEALKFLGIGMGGLLIALQALMSYKRAKALEDNVEATERGQRQERLKNAIEHLGHKSDSVRLGGAYELFHLAQDILELRQTVLDILCAHIRRTTGEPEYRIKYRSKPSEEIQSLLTLLFVQEHQVFTGLYINLQESWLNGSDLGHARLENAVLRKTKLHGADLRDARLHGASLWNTQLPRAYLAGAQLHGADLMGAQLHGASLWHTQLPGASLWDARLHEAELVGVQLHGAFSQPKGWDEAFEESINGRIGKESDLSGAIFVGGLTQESVASIGTGLSEERTNLLRERLAAHIGKPASNELPENSGAITGAYTAEQAAQWIAEYKTATSAVSESG